MSEEEASDEKQTPSCYALRWQTPSFDYLVLQTPSFYHRRRLSIISATLKGRGGGFQVLN